MLRVRQAKTAHAEVCGSTCLMIQRMNFNTAFGVSTRMPRKHTMQSLVLSCIHCPLFALEDSCRKTYCGGHALPIDSLQLSENNGRHCIQQPRMQQLQLAGTLHCVVHRPLNLQVIYHEHVQGMWHQHRFVQKAKPSTVCLQKQP